MIPWLYAEFIAPSGHSGTHDFVIAARVKELRDPGSMSPHQVFAGHVFGFAIGCLTGVRYNDMCAYRAIRRATLERLAMREMTYGWNIEMQFKVARQGGVSWKCHCRIVAAPAANQRSRAHCAAPSGPHGAFWRRSRASPSQAARE